MNDPGRNREILRSLNQLLAVGNVINSIPVGISLSQFLYSEMRSIKGVESCQICLYPSKVPFGDRISNDCSSCDFLLRHGKCIVHEKKEFHSFPLSTSNGIYAYITLKSNEDFPFELLPAIQNLANIAAISIENINQAKILRENNEELKMHRLHLEQKVNERTLELETSNAKLRKTVNILNQAQAAAHVGHWELDLVNDILTWSDEVYKVFEVIPSGAKLSLKDFLERIYPEDRDFVETEFYNSIRNKTSYNIEHRLALKSGIIKYVQEIGRVEYNEDDEPVTAVGMVLDVTDRKNSELLLAEREMQLYKQNEEYEKLNSDLLKAVEKANENDRLKTAFLHNISHEIRTPMNAIVGFSGILNDSNLTANKRQQFIDIIIQSSNQLLSIIDDIVKVATIEAGQMRVNKDLLNLNEMMKLLYAQFNGKAKEQNIEFSYSTGLDDKAEILTDAIKLEEIISNLIGNALKFTHQGFVHFGYQKNDGWLEFFVKDTGIGIPREIQSEIFERFRQAEVNDNRNYGGSGLGLSISKSYVELLGGTIWLESESNAGSTFYFTIPFIQADKIRNTDDAKSDNLMDLKEPKKILIAEDEDFNYLFLSEILDFRNLRLVRAVDGIEATDICKNDKDINLVLMDIKMPRLDGFQATKLIKQFRPDLPVIAQTALTHESDKDNAISCGCIDFVRKPIAKNELIRLIRKYI